MTSQDEAPDQHERRALSREAGLKLVLLSLMAVAVPAALLANYTEPTAVGLALVTGAYLATVAVHVWSLETSSLSSRAPLLLGRIQLGLMLLVIVLAAALLLA